MSTVDEFYHLIILNFFWLENYYGFIVEKLENIDKNKVKVLFTIPLPKISIINFLIYIISIWTFFNVNMVT